MSKRFHQGKYKVKNLEKFIGDPTDCIFRSGWERTLMNKLDNHSQVVKWGSEAIVIPYVSPIDGKVHRYFTDFIVVVKAGDKFVTTLIEVKPNKETLPPIKKGKKKSRYLYECKTYLVNQAKWSAAKKVCEKKGWKWVVIGEDVLLHKF